MPSMAGLQLRRILEVVGIGLAYIGTSAALINFNKYLMQPGCFPHAVHLTALHMVMTSTLSLLFYAAAPQLFPTMPWARKEWRSVLKYIGPLGMLFAIALYSSNKAYVYSSVAFLQFCKEGNVVLVFAMACAAGVQTFSCRKISILSVVVVGCTMCARGDVNFVLLGLVFQLISQVCECSKNLIGEVVMSGAGLKLDVLTFVSFQAPCSLVPLLAGAIFAWDSSVLTDLARMWPLLIANASLAYLLNLLIALTLKRLSAVAFVIIGVTKDLVIVWTSVVAFGQPLVNAQKIGFAITIFGIGLWSHLKIEEQAKEKKQGSAEEVLEGCKEADVESEPLLPPTERPKERAAGHALEKEA